MFLIGFFGMAVPVWVSIELAFRWRPVYAKLNAQLDRYQQVIEPLRRLAMYGIPVLLGIFAGVATASRWQVVLEWLNRTPTGKTDPQFHLDISFYLFELPFYQSVARVRLGGRAALGYSPTLATSYLYGSLRVNGRELRISQGGAHPARHHRRGLPGGAGDQHLARPVRDDGHQQHHRSA